VLEHRDSRNVLKGEKGVSLLDLALKFQMKTFLAHRHSQVSLGN
jgi:hypothetical protein